MDVYGGFLMPGTLTKMRGCNACYFYRRPVLLEYIWILSFLLDWDERMGRNIPVVKVWCSLVERHFLQSHRLECFVVAFFRMLCQQHVLNVQLATNRLVFPLQIGGPRDM
jgi:hypothetical protein